MTTNITDHHRAAFEALASGDYANFTLFSCFVNGEPAAAIVAGMAMAISSSRCSSASRRRSH
jgi:hypothetical protein